MTHVEKKKPHCSIDKKNMFTDVVTQGSNNGKTGQVHVDVR